MVVKAGIQNDPMYLNHAWFNRKKIPKSTTIASDYWMIHHLFDQSYPLIEETIHETSKRTKLTQLVANR